MSTLNALNIRRGRRGWVWSRRCGRGVGGWRYTARNGDGHIIITVADHHGHTWIHASMTRNGHVPDYEDLKHLHQAVFNNGWAYQVFAPPTDHINIHAYALHLWGRADGNPALPNFAEVIGSI